MQTRTKAIWHDERAGLNQCKITYAPKSIKEAKVEGEGGCPASPEGYYLAAVVRIPAQL